MTNALKAWEEELAALPAPEKIYPLTRPHPRFQYPAFPEWRPEKPAEAESEGLTQLRRLLRPEAPESVSLASDFSKSLEQWLGSELGLAPGARVAATAPWPWELQEATRALGLTLEAIPRDPLDNLGFDWSGYGALIFFNPQRGDGFYYPQELFDRILEGVRARAPELPILVDESLSLFCFNDEAPGLWSVSKNPRRGPLWMGGSVFPVLSPQGPEMSWTYPLHRAQHPGTTLSPGTKEVREALRALLAFRSRQNSAVAEFHRRLLAVKLGLRSFTENLGPARARGLLEISFWPEAGFHLGLKLQGLGVSDLRPFLRGLYQRTGLQLIPSPIFYAPEAPAAAYLCYAASPALLENAGKVLNQALLADDFQAFILETTAF